MLPAGERDSVHAKHLQELEQNAQALHDVKLPEDEKEDGKGKKVETLPEDEKDEHDDEEDSMLDAGLASLMAEPLWMLRLRGHLWRGAVASSISRSVPRRRVSREVPSDEPLLHGFAADSSEVPSFDPSEQTHSDQASMHMEEDGRLPLESPQTSAAECCTAYSLFCEERSQSTLKDLREAWIALSSEARCRYEARQEVAPQAELAPEASPATAEAPRRQDLGSKSVDQDPGASRSLGAAVPHQAERPAPEASPATADAPQRRDHGRADQGGKDPGVSVSLEAVPQALEAVPQAEQLAPEASPAAADAPQRPFGGCDPDEAACARGQPHRSNCASEASPQICQRAGIPPHDASGFAGSSRKNPRRTRSAAFHLGQHKTRTSAHRSCLTSVARRTAFSARSTRSVHVPPRQKKASASQRMC